MSEKTATIIGATGFIGSHLLNQLMQDSFYDYIRILVRRPIAITNERLEVKLVNFDDFESVKLALDGSNAVFSCIGTTNKNVKGDKKLYWKTDHDIAVNACRMAKETGCEKFIFVSAVGANSKSRNFYIKMKGQTEDDVIATGMPEIYIMRPGLLLGNRENENRPLEKILQKLFMPLSKIMAGPLKKYKAIEGRVVARAMIAASKKNERGVFICNYEEMISLL